MEGTERERKKAKNKEHKNGGCDGKKGCVGGEEAQMKIVSLLKGLMTK